MAAQLELLNSVQAGPASNLDIRVICELVGGATEPAVLIQTIDEQIGQFVGDAPQFDDIPLLAITRTK